MYKRIPSRYRSVHCLAAAVLCALPALAVAVVANVNISLVDGGGNSLQFKRLVLNPGPDAQYATNHNDDNKIAGITLNEGDTVEVEATDKDGNKFTGTFTVPRGSGRPGNEIDVTVTVRPKGSVPADSGSRQARQPDSTPARSPNTTRQSSRGFATRQSTPLVDSRAISTGTTVSTVELEKIPTARDPWTILQQTPGVIVDRVNTGGNESGQQSSFVGRGSMRDDTSWAVDGVIITDQSALGSTPSYYDFSAIEEIQIDTGANDLDFSTGGVRLNLVTKRGDNTFRASARYDYSNNNWGFTDSRSYGLTARGKFDSIDLGGPIVRDKLWIWTTYTLSAADAFRGPTELENYAAKINGQLSDDSMSLVEFYELGNKIKTGRSAAPSRPQSTTWDQAGPTDIWKLEDTHVFNSNFYLAGLSSYVGGGFQLTPGSRLDTLNTPAGSQAFFGRLGQSPVIDGNYFFNTGAVAHDLRFGVTYTDPDQPNPFLSDEQLSRLQSMFQFNSVTGYGLYPTSQGIIYGGGVGRINEQNKPAQPPEQFMLQGPTDYTLEHAPPDFGEGRGPKLARGRGVKMANYAWVFPGNWQTEVAMGFDQRQVALTAPAWLDASSVVLIDDSVFGKPVARSATAAMIESLWRTSQSTPQPCGPVFSEGAQPSRAWMLLQTGSGKSVHRFVLDLHGRNGWVELGDDGHARLFGHSLRYDPAGHILWLTGGNTRLNKELVYSIGLSKLARSWISLTNTDKPFDANNNPLRLCGTGKAVPAPVAAPARTAVNGGMKKNAAKRAQPSGGAGPLKLTGCANIKDKVPAKTLALALRSPASVAGAGYACHPAAPHFPGNPQRTSLSLRYPDRDYHPLFNPLVATCSCGA